MNIIDVLADFYLNVDEVKQPAAQNLRDCSSISFNSIEDLLFATGVIVSLGVFAYYYSKKKNIRDFYDELKPFMYDVQKYIPRIF